MTVEAGNGIPKMMQIPGEIEALAAVIRRENCRSLLEIGSKHGGSLVTLAQAMPAGSRVVSVDLPNGTREWSDSNLSLKSAIATLRDTGYDAHLIWGDSTDPAVVKQAQALGPFDVCFIDANHTLPYVEKDWEAYGQAARIVAFHDVGWFRNSTWEGTRIDVPMFWNHLRSRYRHEEFRLCPDGKSNGIGVLWRS